MERTSTTEAGETEPTVRLGRRLRDLRLERAMSVRLLADEAGFSPSFISQVENGQASPSIASLDRIARVLDVELSDLFAPPALEATIVRSHDRQGAASEWSRARIEVLSRVEAGGVDAILVTLRGGGRSGAGAQAIAKTQFAFVVGGAIRLSLGEDEHELSAGDAVTIPAGAPHQWHNTGGNAVQVLVVKPGVAAPRRPGPRKE